MVLNFNQYFSKFIKLLNEGKIEIYNEFSFQHEFGIYLRNQEELKSYKIQFERNVRFFCINKKNTIKKEIDIVIYNEKLCEAYAIELKFPLNGEYPETMYNFIKDINFCEQLCKNGFTDAVAFSIVNDKLYYSGNYSDDKIYKYFRSNSPITGIIEKPTGSKREFVEIEKSYTVNWHPVNDDSLMCYTISTAICKNNNVALEFQISSIISEAKRPKTTVINKTVESSSQKHHIQKSTYSNIGIKEIKEFIRTQINYVKATQSQFIKLSASEIHRSLNLKQAVPSVCNEMKQVASEFTNASIFILKTVKNGYSTTVELHIEFEHNTSNS